MQNQNNLAQQEQIRILFKEQCKILLIVMYITCVGVAGFCVLGIISSQKLSNDYSYYSGLQTTIIAFCSLTILSLFFLIQAMVSTTTKQCSKFLTQFAFCIPSVALGLMLASIIISIPNNYCGYYIKHDGDADGQYIKTRFQTQSNYPSCYSMENNNLSVKDQILTFSVIIILDYCRLMISDIQGCANLSSLRVENWSSMFTLQLTSVIGFGVLSIIFGVLLTLLKKRYKIIQDQLKKNAIGQTPYYLNSQYQNQQQKQVNTSSNSNQIIQGQYPQQQQYQQYLYQPPQQFQTINYNNPHFVVGQPINQLNY